MTEFTLLNELCESRLIPTKSSLRKWDSKALNEAAYLYFLALRVLIKASDTKDWAIHYCDRTSHWNSFDTWRSDANDFYVLLYSLIGDPDRKSRTVSASAIKQWFRHIAHPDFDDQSHQLFTKLDGMFKITDSALRSLRRSIAYWENESSRDRQDVISKLIQQLKKRGPNSELLSHLRTLSDIDDDDVNESATAGATSAASIATSVGTLGAGFAREPWRSIYGQRKKPKLLRR